VKSEPRDKSVDLEEWEDLFRNQFFYKVTEAVEARIGSLQSNASNRSKQSMGLDESVKTAGDMRAIGELSKILSLFESLKNQIHQTKKGVTDE